MSMLEVDTKGLRELQKGKPLTFIINELCQNVFDEQSTKCIIDIVYNSNQKLISVRVEDDNPEGFKDITHAYTLFRHTEKRLNPEQRGRFNLAEKQIAVCSEKTTIKTTKGTIILDTINDKRIELDEYRKEGSEILVILKGTKKQYDEMIEHTKKIICPKDIEYIVNGNKMPKTDIYKSFKAKLLTELLKNGIMVKDTRKTSVNLVE